MLTVEQENARVLLLEYMEKFDTKTKALRKMNTALGTRYDLNRFGQWRRKEQTVPKIVVGFLLGVRVKSRVSQPEPSSL